MSTQVMHQVGLSSQVLQSPQKNRAATSGDAVFSEKRMHRCKYRCTMSPVRANNLHTRGMDLEAHTNSRGIATHTIHRSINQVPSWLHLQEIGGRPNL